MKSSAELKRDIESEVMLRKREQAKIDSDPFLRCMKDAENEHLRQLTAIRQENAALKQRLELITSSCRFSGTISSVLVI